MNKPSQQELQNAEVTVYWAVPYLGSIQKVEVLRETTQTIWIRTYSNYYGRHTVDMRRKRGLNLYESWEAARQALLAMTSREIESRAKQLEGLHAKLATTEALEDPTLMTAAEGLEASANA